jgi:hypothetical protein
LNGIHPHQIPELGFIPGRFIKADGITLHELAVGIPLLDNHMKHGSK